MLELCMWEWSRGRRPLTVRAITKAMKHESQTAFKGTSCRFTTCHSLDPGRAPSREKAYTILSLNKTPLTSVSSSARNYRNFGGATEVNTRISFRILVFQLDLFRPDRKKESYGWFPRMSWPCFRVSQANISCLLLVHHKETTFDSCCRDTLVMSYVLTIIIHFFQMGSHSETASAKQGLASHWEESAIL